MIPSRWSSAIAILRRRQAEALAEERALRRTMVVDPDDESSGAKTMPDTAMGSSSRPVDR